MENNYFNNDSIVYVEGRDILGAVAVVDYGNQLITIVDEEDNTHVVGFEEVTHVMQEIGDIDGLLVYEGDVIEIAESGKMYELTINKDGKLVLAFLDDNLEIIGYGNPINKELISEFKDIASLVGNIHQLRKVQEEVEPLFTALRVSSFSGEVEYVHAFKTDEGVDVVRLPFFGTHSLTQPYGYFHMSHEEYEDWLGSEFVKVVDPMELANYAVGLNYEDKVQEVVFGEDEEDEEDEYCCDEPVEDAIDEEACDDCGKSEDNCNCELWTK